VSGSRSDRGRERRSRGIRASGRPSLRKRIARGRRSLLRRLFGPSIPEDIGLSYRAEDGLAPEAMRLGPWVTWAVGALALAMILWLAVGFGARLWRQSHARPLLRAADSGDAERVRALVAAGVDVNAADPKGDTALGAAARRGDARMVAMLLDAGATPTPEAVRWAIMNGHHDVLKALIRAGADPNTTCAWDGRCPLTEAVRRGDAAFARELLARGAAPSPDVARLARPPLHTAAADGNEEIVRLLLEHGADPRVLWQARTPAQIARDGGQTGTARILEEAEAAHAQRQSR